MTSQGERASRFLQQHRPGSPLLMPNAWDAGSAKLLQWLGFEAIATTSSGHAATLGRLDGSVGRDEALAHATALVEATALPVSADLENGYGEDLGEVARTVELAVQAGLAGCSIEDFGGGSIYERDVAVKRVQAAVQAGSSRIVLTARAENYLHGRPDLEDTIARLQAYQEAGADVLYAPGLRELEDIRKIVTAVQRPVNVLALPGGPSVADLAGAGVARISVGGAFAFAALGSAVEAARELREQGTYGFWERSKVGRDAVKEAFR